MQEKSSKKMSLKTSVHGRRRLWNILRLALLWTRKGSMLRNRLVFNLNVLGKGIRKLRQSNEQQQRGALVYGDREFSFDDTPIIHVKMHRPSSMRFKMPNIPCINPHVDFDYDFELEDDIEEIDHRICYEDNKYLKEREEEVEEYVEEEMNWASDEGIDLKAEEFIAKFYEQMKMQRQISYLQYNDKLNRGAS